MLASCCCSACVSGVCLGDCSQHSGLHRYCPERCLELSSKPIFKRYYHFVMHSLFLGFAFVISYICLNPQVANFLPHIPMVHGSCSETKSLYCYGVNTVYRVSLALTLFYFAHLIASLTAKRYYLNCYVIRWIAFIVLSGLAILLPGIVVKVYAWITMPIAALFLIMMVIIWVDFAYEWQQVWSQRDNRIWLALLNIFTALFTVGFIVLTILQFIFFNCTEARIFSAVNLSLSLICYLLPMKLQRVHLLPVSVIVVYNTYVVFMGLNYGVGLESSCYYRNVTTSNTDNPIGFSTIFDTFLTLVSLIWTAFSIANSHTVFSLKEREYTTNIFYQSDALNLSDPTVTVVNTTDNIAEAIKTEEKTGSSSGAGTGVDPESLVDVQEEVNEYEEIERSRRLRQYQFFFFVMTLASSYMLMTLSSWQVYGHSIQSRIDSGRTSMYIKIASTYICYLLFIIYSFIPNLTLPTIFDSG